MPNKTELNRLVKSVKIAADCELSLRGNSLVLRIDGEEIKLITGQPRELAYYLFGLQFAIRNIHAFREEDP